MEMAGNGNQNILSIRTEKPRIEIESKLGKLHIDQSACFSEAGRKGMADFRADVISYAHSVYARGIARIVDNGNQMIEIQNPADAIAEQADYNAFGMFEQEFVYTTIPKSRPKITVDAATLNYKFHPGRLENTTRERAVQISYTAGNVRFYTY